MRGAKLENDISSSEQYATRPKAVLYKVGRNENFSCQSLIGFSYCQTDNAQHRNYFKLTKPNGRQCQAAVILSPAQRICLRVGGNLNIPVNIDNLDIWKK